MPWRNDFNRNEFQRSEFDRDGSGYDGSEAAPEATLAALPEQLRDMVERELDEGETVVWADRPIPMWLTRATLPLVLFGIPWTAFTIFFMVLVVTSTWDAQKNDANPDAAAAPAGAQASEDAAENKGRGLPITPLFGVLFCTPHLLIGLGLLSSPYWKRRAMLRTVFAITDRRALVFQGGFFSTTVRSFEPDTLKKLHRTTRAKGVGDICFETPPPSGGTAVATLSFAGNAGFYNIRNVRDVERLLRNIGKNKGE